MCPKTRGRQKRRVTLMKPINNHTAEYPEFMRLPRPGERCKATGLSRTTLCELISGRYIKAKKLRKRGSLRGITLIFRDSLIAYLHSLEDAANISEND